VGSRSGFLTVLYGFSEVAMRLGFGDCIYDSGSREVTRGKRVLALPPKTFQLLELLIKRRPNVVPKQEIHESLWPGTFVSDASLAKQIAELRAALDDDARAPAIIRTVHRFGYAFHANVHPAPSRADAAVPSGVVCRLVWDGCEIQLTPGENLLGRDTTAAVWIDDPAVSREHALIVVGDEGATLEDLRSKNGTKLHGRKIEGVVPLSDRDTIRVGPATIVFRSYRHTGSTETASEDEPPQ
jgi:DNA-binding winged helix-turn-helix (wHTH) protein